MGLMDAINPDTKMEIKVGDLFNILSAAAKNEKAAGYLLNGVKNEVPYKYIREIITGEKEPDATEDPVVMNANIEIHASELAKTIKKTILDKAAGAEDPAAGAEDPAAGAEDPAADPEAKRKAFEKMSRKELKDVAEYNGILITDIPITTLIDKLCEVGADPEDLQRARDSKKKGAEE